MKLRQYLLFISALFFLAAPAWAAVDWSVDTTIATKAALRDVVPSFDGNSLFVLTEAGELVMYDAGGKVQGRMKVAEGMDQLAISGFQKAGVPEQIVISNSKTGQIQKVSFSTVVQIPLAGSPFLGNPEAPVAVVVFSDFQCPYCEKAQVLLEEILEQNPDNIKIVFKNFPLSFHKQAQPAALAAIAAHKQGKFWQYHDKLFANHKSLTAESYAAFAKELGLDLDTFNRDRISPMARQKLVADINLGKQVGVTGTPAIYINGHRVKKRSAEVIQQMIDAELAKQ